MKYHVDCNVEMAKREGLVKTHIDDWDELVISHPLFTLPYLYSMIFMLEDLEFVDRAYIASNGLLRLNIKGRKPTVFDDIAIHPREGEFMIMRNYKRDIYKQLEDEISLAIEEYTARVASKIEVDSISELFK